MSLSSQTITVMQILPALENGGVERGTVDLARNLQEHEIEPIVVSSGGILTYQLKEAGVLHIKLPVHSKNPFTIIRNIDRIRNLIKEHNVDIVHVRSRAPMWSTYYACKGTDAKLVSTVHGPYSIGNPLKKIYNKRMLDSDLVIAVSNFVKRYLRKNYENLDESKLKVVARGVDVKKFDLKKVSQNQITNLIKDWNLDEGKKIIFMPARFTSWKGHKFLIESLAKVKNDFLCVMAGSDHGHERFKREIEKLIIEKNLSAKIKIVGVCSDMPTAYAVSHFVVCPSLRPEAFGRIAIEAQSLQKMIVATNIGGSLETIIENETGFLVRTRDVDGFAKKIDQILEMSQEEVSKMGAAGRKNVEKNFSSQKMCDSVIEGYKSLLNPCQTP